jgi:acetylornithine deacetylase
MEYFIEKWIGEMAFLPVGSLFLEPTEENIGLCHKGFIWHEIEVFGKAAHGSRPHKGVDGILPLRAALDEIAGIQLELLEREADPLLGHATLHASMIQGGEGWSTIPSRSSLRWERRTLPGESKESLMRELDRVIRAVQNYPGNHKVSGREVFFRPPYRVPEDAEILNRLQQVSPQSKQIGLSFWSDSALTGLRGIPSVIFGPTGHGAHAKDEWVSLKSLVRVYETLKKMIMSF